MGIGKTRISRGAQLVIQYPLLGYTRTYIDTNIQPCGDTVIAALIKALRSRRTKAAHNYLRPL